MSIDTDRPASRRAVLTAALGGAAALGVQALASAPGVRGASVPLMTETTNTAGLMTALDGDLPGQSAFYVINSSASTDPPHAALGGNDSVGYGVWAVSGTGVGVFATTGDAANAADPPGTDYTGVYGFVDGAGVDQSQFLPTGVWGDTQEGVGVYGSGPTGVAGVGGWGVYGYSQAIGGVGVFADSNLPAVALHVEGKAHFSRSGKASVGRTRTSVSVAVPGATSASMVLATIQANKLGLYVKGAVATTNRITIYLSKKPPIAVKVAFIVLD